jgi:hypothetical protein
MDDYDAEILRFVLDDGTWDAYGLLAEVEQLREEVERLTRERDALLGRLTGRCDDQWGGHFALVEIRPAPFSVTDHHGRSNHVALCQWCETEAQAVAAARRAAGLGADGEGEVGDGPTPAG